MKKNVIILTTGLSGSSPLTGLISQAGYWTGDSTYKKKDYDTFETQELIDLNVRLFEEAGYDGNYEVEYVDEPIHRIKDVHDRIDKAPFESFIAKCNAHRPWVWKDPRLWRTIRFWIRFLDPEDLGAYRSFIHTIASRNEETAQAPKGAADIVLIGHDYYAFLDDGCDYRERWRKVGRLGEVPVDLLRAYGGLGRGGPA